MAVKWDTLLRKANVITMQQTILTSFLPRIALSSVMGKFSVHKALGSIHMTAKKKGILPQSR